MKTAILKLWTVSAVVGLTAIIAVPVAQVEAAGGGQGQKGASSNAASLYAKVKAADGQAGDFFGAATAVSGDTMVVSAYLDDDYGESSGAAYVYRWNGTGWVEEAKLVPNDPQQKDLFGVSVDVEGDTIAVGSFYDDDMGSHSGSAYVFSKVAGSWVEEAKLIAPDGIEGDLFGFSVAISGDLVAVGAPAIGEPKPRAGKAYVYRRDESGWRLEATLMSNAPEAGAGFGYSLALEDVTLLVGAVFADVAAVDTGAVYVFRLNAGLWVQEARLAATDGARKDYFGSNVSLSGTTAVVSGWKAGKGGSGAAYVLSWNGSAWSEEAKLVAGKGGSRTGSIHSVAIEGDIIAVGVPLAQGMAKETGAVVVYNRSGEGWMEHSRIHAADGQTGDHFGEWVSLDGGRLAVGAPRHDEAGVNAGAVYATSL